jgi:2'-5' RNA ligase
MYAIISELNEAAAVQVMHLWRELNRGCGLEGIFNYPTPHFTWFSAAEMDVERCKPILEMIAAEGPSFAVHSAGIGLFPGEAPVLYLPVVKSPRLMTLHRSIWSQILPYAQEANPFHSPNDWVPHITLAMRDLTPENLPCALAAVASEPQKLTSIVKTVALVKSENQSTGETLAVFRLADEGAGL